MSIKYNGGYIPAVGADGTTLVANSASATGVAWTAGNPIPNPVINSAFQIAQRGVTISAPAAANTYTLDRWIASTGTGAAATVSRVVTGDTTNLPNIQYCAQVQRNAGQTGTVIWFVQPFETINSIPFVGKQVTFSFYARKGADYSAASSALVGNLYSGTGTDQSWVQGYTGQVTVASTTATLTANWQRFQATGTVGATATELAIQFAMTGVGTALTNDYFQVTGVQIDVSPVALPFRTNAPTLQGELTACQRYYQKSYDTTVNPGTSAANGYSYSNLLSVANNSPYLSNPIKSMRVAPTVTIYGYNGTAGTVSEASTGVDKAANTGQASAIGTEGFVVRNGNATTQTFSQGAIYQYTASAEL